MNKTINVSLGKQFFHIDEEAFIVLKNYLDAIKRYLINEEGRDEILADVEARIAELFSEKLQSEREVVQVHEVERVIKIMGQPSDYKVEQEDDTYTNTQSETYSNRQNTQQSTGKKFYRDEEKNLLGGVCAGLAHNFGIDILWMRILWMVLFFLSYGTFTILYVVLWIVVPAARTTAQKLAMMGEPINISNIEKKVKENAEKATNYAKNFDYEKAAQNGKSTVTRFVEQLTEILSKVANVLVKIIGFILVFIAGLSLVGMFISFISFGSISFLNIADFNLSNEGPFVFEAPVWLQMLTFFCIAATPVYFLFLAGLKIINHKLKLFKLRTVVILLALWFLAIAYVSFLGIKKGISSNSIGEIVEIQELPMQTSDTLSIKMIPNLTFAESIYRSSSNQIKYDSSTEEDILVGTSIYFAVQPTTDSIPKIRVSKKSTGSNNKEGRLNASQIDYQFKLNKNELLLDSYFTSDISLKDEDLKLNIILYLPENMHFKTDKYVSTFEDYKYHKFVNLNVNSNDVYQIQNTELICTTCTKNEPKTENHE
ncbi:PspC domain-containing protein [Psychroflexus planctonicus]|uniref:Phage shock protein C (PspC) family protein n=1 Tax=Psychroflexus planctonicus TaxID=1526575 RepID=A0ABQ1SJW8_9FLAO|nr:PspC domain-containing protein [Psychroflexus planctonicus]GGE39861.1 hypothetical protein GCM10010832_20070 [Psychroflexus planctonicus]